MTYPDGIDALVNVNATDTLAAGGHAARHNSVNTALEELADVLTVPATNTLALVPDGTTERFRIDSAGLITGAGTSLGAWTTWTPTTTGITLGNGTISARYVQFGKTVHFSYLFNLGSTSAVSGDHLITLPVARRNSDPVGQATVILRDVGVAGYSGLGFYIPTNDNQIGIRPVLVSGSVVVQTLLSSTVPFTWGDADQIICSGTYEAA
jgi:hypothetical protein